MAEHWRLKPEVSWVGLPAADSLFTSLYFCLITSKFIYFQHEARCSEQILGIKYILPCSFGNKHMHLSTHVYGMCCEDVSGIYASMQCVWALPLMEVSRYNASNTVTWSNRQWNNAWFLPTTAINRMRTRYSHPIFRWLSSFVTIIIELEQNNRHPIMNLGWHKL